MATLSLGSLPRMATLSLVLFSIFFNLLPVPSYCICKCICKEGSNAGRRRETELVSGMFVFGDSLVDAGNNNYLPSFAKANYFPYGIDFPGCPTGRFSDGYTIVDEIADLLGLPLIPPYSHPFDDILHGVNYASAAAGILDDTGRDFVGRIPFNQQIKNFESTLVQITNNLGADAMVNFIAHYTFFVGFGNNDYLNNYLLPNYNTRLLYNSEQFASLLVQQYTNQLTTLYNLGARRFMIAGIGLLGCVPNILSQTFLGECSLEINNLVIPFNKKIVTMVNNLNANLLDAKLIYINIVSMFVDILENPIHYGFTVTNRGCCGSGRNHGQITCLPCQFPCLNRNQHVFWDAYHPTAAVNIILAREAFSGNTNVVYPMNIQQLAILSL